MNEFISIYLEKKQRMGSVGFSVPFRRPTVSSSAVSRNSERNVGFGNLGKILKAFYEI
jgi:hypothetical protein